MLRTLKQKEIFMKDVRSSARTSRLTRGECAELCDFIHAWAADNGVELRDARQWVDPETGEVMQ